MHNESTAAVRAYGKTSDEFAVTSGVRQGCVLAPTLFNLFFDAVIHMAIDDHLEEGGVRIVFNPDAKLVGDRRKMTLETQSPTWNKWMTWSCCPTHGVIWR